MRIPRNDRGQVAPLLAVLIMVAGGAALLLGRLGGLAVGRAQVETAADAAALAGAGDGRSAAARLAAANGARLSGYSVDGADTQVEVRLGEGLVAVARARPVGPAGSWAVPDRALGSRAGLAPAMLAALARAEQLLGRAVPIVSGHRSAAQQAALWASRGRNRYPVAAPGRSMHERGLAIDVPAPFVSVLRTVVNRAGLCQPVPTDPIHFEVCRWIPKG